MPHPVKLKKAKIPPKIAESSVSSRGLPDTCYTITENGANCIAFDTKINLGMPTVDQLKKMLVHPTVEGAKVRLMPDGHKCPGCLVGFTYEMKSIFQPSTIGPDIGCGVLTYLLHPKIIGNRSLEKIEAIIRKSSKIGNGYKNIWNMSIITDLDLNRLYQESQSLAIEFAHAYFNKFGYDITKHIPNYNIEWLKNKCRQIECDYETDVLKAAGTLGGGNHFVEIDQDLETGDNYLTIHCGSRTFGSNIYKYHQNKINFNRQFPDDEFDDKLKHIDREHKDSKTKKILVDEVLKEIYANKHPVYLEGDEVAEYFMDMIFCQNYAILNRRLMLKHILEALKPSSITTYLGDDLPPLEDELITIQQNMEITTNYYDETKIIESIHNYIDFRSFIVRKGAISAQKGEKCIVAFNMADGIMICEGKGNDEWNQSCAHGSGRAISRQKAQSSLSMKQFHESMKNVCTTSVCKGTLDESPAAYKDTQSIIDLLGPTVTILKRLTSVLNLKASNDD